MKWGKARKERKRDIENSAPCLVAAHHSTTWHASQKPLSLVRLSGGPKWEWCKSTARHIDWPEHPEAHKPTRILHRQSREKSTVMPVTAVPSESPAAVWSKEDADLSAAFGPLFRALPKELISKIVPAERTVMLCRVSRGARWALAAARPAAVVKERFENKSIGGTTIKKKYTLYHFKGLLTTFDPPV